MKINIKAFTTALTIIFTAMILIISIWTRLSTQFGQEFMSAFNSIHPHPFVATLDNLSMAEEFYGIGLDLFYAVIDSIIFSLGFALLYNKMDTEQTEEETTTE